MITPAQMQPCRVAATFITTSMARLKCGTIASRMSGAALCSSSACPSAQHQPVLPSSQLRLRAPHLRLANGGRSKLHVRTVFRHRKYRFYSADASTSSTCEDGIPQTDTGSSSAEARGTSAESPARNSAVSDTSSSGVDGAPVQFEIHRIAGDGSCLFRAVAQGAHHTSTGVKPCAEASP